MKNKMKTLSEKIIEQLQSKHDAFLGTKGELSRQRFKDGLMWAIDTVETLTKVDDCEKEHEAEQLRTALVSVPKGTVCKCENPDIYQDNTGLIYCFDCKEPMTEQTAH